LKPGYRSRAASCAVVKTAAPRVCAFGNRYGLPTGTSEGQRFGQVNVWVVGCGVGASVGIGDAVGVRDGICKAVGEPVWSGRKVGSKVGRPEGVIVSGDVGASTGAEVGPEDGLSVGGELGATLAVGVDEGTAVGCFEGRRVGAPAALQAPCPSLTWVNVRSAATGHLA
jgi:hypothetical protein